MVINLTYHICILFYVFLPSIIFQLFNCSSWGQPLHKLHRPIWKIHQWFYMSWKIRQGTSVLLRYCHLQVLLHEERWNKTALVWVCIQSISKNRKIYILSHQNDLAITQLQNMKNYFTFYFINERISDGGN